MSQRPASATALAGLILLAVLTFRVDAPDGSRPWDRIERDRWSARLAHATPGSWMADKAADKIAELDALRDNEPGQDHPDEYMRYQQLSKTPSDREFPEYTPGYQMRELKRAQATGGARKVSLPWVNRGPGNVAGRARSIVIDPSDPTGQTWLIATAGGGIWKTTDKGQTWAGLMEEQPMLQTQSLAISPADPLTIYAGTGESYWNIDTMNGNGVFKSIDGGATWAQLPSTVDDTRFNNVSRIIVDPDDENLVLISTTVGTTKASLQPTSHIFRSADGGANWTEVHQETGAASFAGPRILQLVADPQDFNIQYAAVNGAGILKSTDSGLTWFSSNTGITDFSGRFELAISPINSDYIFASAQGTAASTAISRLWHSTNGGATWVGGTEGSSSPSWLGGQGWYDNTITCSPVNPAVVYVGGVQLWTITINTLGVAGYGISQLSTGPVHSDNHGLQIVQPQGGAWYILNTNDGGVGYSTSGASNWSAPIAGLTTTQFYGVDKRPGASAYVGGMQDNGTWRSPVGSASTDPWFAQIGGDGYETSWHFDDADKIIGGYQYNGLQRSLDGGATWEGATSGLGDLGSNAAPFLTKIGKSNARPDHVFAVGASGPWRSTNFGASWNLMTLNSGNWGGNNSFLDVRVSEANPDVVWTGSRMDGVGDIFVSTNGGVNFDPVTQYGAVTMGRISGMATHPTEPGTAYLLFSFAERPKVLKTTNYGLTWDDISGFDGGSTSDNGFPDVAVYDLIVFPNDPDTIWVGSEIGLIESTDGGASWALADNGFPSVGVWYLLVEEDEVVIASHGRGIWSAQIPELEDGQFFNPLFESMVMPPAGTLNLAANLRSAADSTQVFVNGSVVQTLGPNTKRQIVNLAYPVLTAGTKTAFFRSFKGGTPHNSITRQADVFLLADPVTNYTNNLTNDDDLFIQGGFSIAQPSGFSNPALHTTHDYPDNQSLVAVLTQPIVVGNATTLSFDEVAIVEPGDPGTVFGDFAFWDYVIVEGSLDGQNWLPLLDGYDAREQAVWLSAFNTSANGNSSMFRSRQLLINDTFALRDVIFIRFRLLADSSVNGWGWAIDNINVNTPAPTAAPAQRRFDLAQNTPNPFNPQTQIEFALPEAANARLQVFDLRGRLVKTLINGPRTAGPQSVTWDGRDARGARVSSGVYLYRLQAGDQVQQRKMTLVK